MLREEFTESEVYLITQGLDLLLAQKRDALRQACHGVDMCAFVPSDFAIPQIQNLQQKIDGATVWPDDESEVPA